MINQIIKHKKQFVKDGIIFKKVSGYIFVKCGLGWMPQHQLVVENFIGRTLNKGEVIHHIDGNKENNLIENLMLFKTQNEHSSFHNKIRQFGLTQPILKQISERWDEFK